MNPENLNESSGESSARTLSRRSLLGTTASLGIGLFAGCSANSTSGQSEDTPVNTDSSIQTATETEEPVEYPREISDEEIQSTRMAEVYEIEEWARLNEEKLEDIDYETIEAENETRREQIKEVLKETTYQSGNARHNGVLGMAGLTGLSWVDTQAEQMLIDESTIRFNGHIPGIEMIYDDESGNEQIDTFKVFSHTIEDEELLEQDMKRHFHANTPDTRFHNGDPTVATYTDLEAVKTMYTKIMNNDKSEESSREVKNAIKTFNNNFVLGLNDTSNLDDGRSDEVVPITLSDDYWSKLDRAYAEEPETYKEMKIKLSKAAHNVDIDVGHALNAKIEDGETVYEEIKGVTYDQIAPQIDLAS